MISPKEIKWNDLWSTEVPFDIITQCSFDGDSGDSETFLSREAVVSETYNGAMKRGNSYKWNESFAPRITILKKNFSDFTREENRYILSWLTGKQTPGFLDVSLDDSKTIEYSILGNFINVSQYKLGNSRIVGYIATFESLMPWALSKLETKEINGADLTLYEKTNTETGTKIQVPGYIQDIDIKTDEHESAIYPRITIKHNGTNYVRIANGVTLNIHSDMIVNTVYYNGTMFYWKTSGATKMIDTTMPNYNWVVKEVNHAYTDDDMWESGYIYKYNTTYYWLDPNTFHANTENPNLQTTGVKITNTYIMNNSTHVATCSIANNTLDEVVVLDGANKVVSSSRTSRIFGDDFIDWQWLPLYNGKNEIKVEGNCTVTFEYREVRKVGEF